MGSRGGLRRTLTSIPSVVETMESSEQRRRVTYSGAHRRPLVAAGRTDLEGVDALVQVVEVI